MAATPPKGGVWGGMGAASVRPEPRFCGHFAGSAQKILAEPRRASHDIGVEWQSGSCGSRPQTTAHLTTEGGSDTPPKGENDMKPIIRLLLLLAIVGLSYFHPNPVQGDAVPDIECTVVVGGGTACGSCVDTETGCYASGCCTADGPDEDDDPDCNIVAGCPPA